MTNPMTTKLLPKGRNPDSVADNPAKRTGHTPGPWMVAFNDYDPNPVIRGNCIRTDGRGEKTVCVITLDDGMYSIQDARLIAAAPELLEALRPFALAAGEASPVSGISADRVWLWKPSNNRRDTNGISLQHLLDAVAAISKAEGK